VLSNLLNSVKNIWQFLRICSFCGRML